MASLVRFPGGSRNRGDKGRSGPYYAKVYIPRPGQRPKGKLIPLKTETTREAALRIQEVEKVEELIKQNIEFSFPWMNGASTSVKRTTLQEASDEYLRLREDEGIRTKTLGIYRLALKHFSEVAGKNTPIESITTKDVQNFVRFNRDKFSVTSMNIYLRDLKTFLIWACQSKLIPELPKVKEL